MPRRLHPYAAIMTATAAAACAIVATFNLLVDPYGSYRLLSSTEIAVKPAVYRRVKLAKAYDLRRI